MPENYRQQLDSFTIDNLPTLDIAVGGALDLLEAHDLPKIDVNKFKRPLVVGSGNAEATGRILFAGTGAIFASESTVDAKLAKVADIDEVVIISASGSKHAPIIAGKARQAGKHVTLITTSANSPTEQLLSADELSVHVFPKNREPYTYNTSTYMAMIQGESGEDITALKQFIDQQIKTLQLPDFSQYNKFFVIVPPEFEGLVSMIRVKFIELFGRNVARDVETSEYVSHATTVAPSDELFISFGYDNQTWGDPAKRLHIPLPDNAGNVAMMAISYYMVGQIQKAQPAYFMDNIDQYCQFVSTVFGEDIQPIVAGS